jgi:uncharacterized membrane-anchored protein
MARSPQSGSIRVQRPTAGSDPAGTPTRRLLTKVPEITVIFWVMKLLTTGMGEAMSDFMGQKSVPIAAFIGIFGLWLALWLQLRQTHYRAVYYWFAVMMVAIFGTMAADGIHDGAGIGYAVTTPLFAAITAAIFFFWYRSEGTLSIHSITIKRRERFYWLAILATFALGTAAGDLTAYAMNIGFFPSAIVFAIIIALPAIGWYRFNLNPIIAFWLCYVVTRPLGASFADGFSKPTNGGLGLGDGTVSWIALVFFIALVAYVAITKIDVQPELGGHPHPRTVEHPHPAPGHHHPAPPVALEPE